MRKPIKPLPTDCFGTGCPKCIYEVYEEQMEKYRAWKKKQEENQNKEIKKQ